MSSRLARIEGKVLFLEQEVERIEPINGIGINVSDSPTGKGRSISSIAASGGSGGAGFPFQVFVIKDDDDNWFRGVSINSKLFDQLGTDVFASAISITGLLTSSQPADDDAGWVATADADKIWLELTIGTWPAITTAEIKSIEASDTVDGGEVERDDGTGDPPLYAQTKARLMIATIEAAGDAFAVVQLVTNHRRLGICPADARDSTGAEPQPVPTVYPFPL